MCRYDGGLASKVMAVLFITAPVVEPLLSLDDAEMAGGSLETFTVGHSGQPLPIQSSRTRVSQLAVT